jgi:hypothetical protein
VPNGFRACSDERLVLLSTVEEVHELLVIPSADVRVNERFGRNAVAVIRDALNGTLFDLAHDSPLSISFTSLLFVKVFTTQKRSDDHSRVRRLAMVSGLLSTPSPPALLVSSQSGPKYSVKYSVRLLTSLANV